MRSIGSRPSLQRVLLIPSVALLVLIAVFSWQFVRLVRATDFVDHADRVISEIQDIEGNVLQIEAGVRGYAITRSPQFLGPYFDGRENLSIGTQNLSSLLSAQPRQKNRLLRVLKSLDRWYNYVDRLVAITGRGGDPAPLIRAQDGDKITQSVIGKLEGMIGAEIGRRNHFAQRERSRTVFVLVLGCAVALLLFTRLFFILEERVRSDREASRLERQLRFMEMLSTSLSRSLRDETILEKLAELCVPTLSDWCSIQLLENDTLLRRVATAHRESDRRALAQELHTRFPSGIGSDPTLLSRISSGETVLLDGEWLDQVKANLPKRHAELLNQIGTSSSLLLPMRSQNRTFGLVILSKERGSFNKVEIEFAKEVISRSSLAVENAHYYQQAQRAIRAREDVVAIVSHDLKNPVAAMQMGSELITKIMSSARTEPGAARLVTLNAAERIETSARQAYRMISDLLDLTKLDAGQFAVEKVPIRFMELIERVVDVLAPMATEKRIRFQIDVHDPECVVQCDPARISRVLFNLVGNALKFSPSDSEIRIRTRAEDGKVCVSVRDQGPGIAPEAIDKLFQRFWQSKEARRHGTGLGLWIAKGIIDAHGGKIWVSSKPGRGAEFTFELPINAGQCACAA